MKNVSFFICLCILFTGFVSLQTQAQDAEMPTMFAVFEEFVSPADIGAFRKAQDNAFEQMDKHGGDFTFWSYRTDENAFYWVMPLMNFASLDGFFQKSMALQQKMKEDGFDGSKEFRDLSTMRSSILRWSQELSYHPSGEYGQTEEKPYCEWTFCYMKAGHEKEAGDAIKKYIDFYENIDESYEWDVYQVVFGHDTPCWILMTRAEDAITMRKLEKDLNGKYKEDFQKMWQNFAMHIRKVENINGWFLPDWSKNLPE